MGPSLQRASGGRKVLTLPADAEYHVCQGFGAARIVHIRRRGAAGYSPVNSRWGAADNSPVNSGRDVLLAYTAELFVTCTVSLGSTQKWPTI